MGITLIDDENYTVKELIRKNGKAIVGSLWECGDEYCNCKQPIIEEVTEHQNFPFTYWQTKRLWEGTYITDDDDIYKSDKDLIREIIYQKQIKCDYIYGTELLTPTDKGGR